MGNMKNCRPQYEGGKPRPVESTQQVPAKDSSKSDMSYRASITGPLPPEFGELLAKLEASMNIPIWLIVQKATHDEQLGSISEDVLDAFLGKRSELKACTSAVLVIDSPGGDAESAYHLSRLFQRHCGGFVAVVPRYAKSAATLLVLGAAAIVVGTDAELGPLDVQITDFQAERYGSALDEVQALERINAAAMNQIDQTMLMLLPRTQKKIEFLLPLVMSYVASMMAPMVEKIDTLHYASYARILKVGEDYAIRLLRGRFSEEDATNIARQLVNAYSEHAFVLDREELLSGRYPDLIETGVPSEVQTLIDEIDGFLQAHARPLLALGRFETHETGGNEGGKAPQESTPEPDKPSADED